MKGLRKRMKTSLKRSRKYWLFLAHGYLLYSYLEVKMSLGSGGFYIFIMCGWSLTLSSQCSVALGWTRRPRHSRSWSWASRGKISFLDSSPKEAKITALPTLSPPTAPTGTPSYSVLTCLSFLSHHFFDIVFMYELYCLSSVSPHKTIDSMRAVSRSVHLEQSSPISAVLTRWAG